MTSLPLTRAQVPLAPPEDILSWLNRIGLLEEEGQDEDEGPGGQSSLLDDEFDLDGEDDAVLLGGGEDNGSNMLS